MILPSFFSSYLNKSRRAFSLVEILVAIAVIGVLVAIAIPTVSGIIERSRATATNQNLSNLASLFSAARAAGNSTNNFDKNGAIDALTQEPGMRGEGNFKQNFFYLPLRATEITAAKNTTSLVGTGTGDAFRLLYTGPAQ